MNLKTLGIGACIIFVTFSRHPANGSGDPSPDGQAAIREQSPVIRISSTLVTVPVSVTDVEGHAIENLGIPEFRIEEDGRLESVFRVVEAGRSPLRLALLLDLSGSVRPHFDVEQQAAMRFLEKVWRSGDTVSVVTFDGFSRIRLQESGSLADVMKALSVLEPTDNPTAFFDAVALSAKTLRQSAGPETRQAVIALSDGEDNRSRRTFSEVLSELQHDDTIFYSINPAGPSIRLNEISLKAQADLSALAMETGGHAFVSDKTADLSGIFLRIAGELQAQYLLSYYSTNSSADGKYRRISVSIPIRTDLRIRARQGYWASAKENPVVRERSGLRITN
jgi:VWFA-related protein